MQGRRAFLYGIACFPLVGLIGNRAVASAPEVFNTSGLAIHGYDPVAYFTDAAPTPGVEDHALRWMGTTWLFASASNMATFEMNPHAYAPRYGGYCAYAMAQGAVATTVPEAWTIHEDRLYLNFSTGVRRLWRKDIAGNIRAADTHWPDALMG